MLMIVNGWIKDTQGRREGTKFVSLCLLCAACRLQVIGKVQQ